MNDFKTTYQEAMEQSVMHVDADSVLAYGRRKERAKRRRRSVLVTAGSLVLLVGISFGPVDAAGYFKNIIRWKDNGFVSADADTMQVNEAAAVKTESMPAPEEEAVAVEKADTPENEMPKATAVAKTAEDMEPVDILGEVTGKLEEPEGVSEQAANIEPGGVSEQAANIEPKAKGEAEAFQEVAKVPGEEEVRQEIQVQEAGVQAADGGTMKTAKDENLETAEAAKDESLETPETAQEESSETPEVEEISGRYYDSYEDYAKAESLPLILPAQDALEGYDTMEIMVLGNMVLCSYRYPEEKTFSLEVNDYSQTQGHASSRVFGDQLQEQWEYTTQNGFTYLMGSGTFGEQEENVSIHGAVAVDEREIYVDFCNFTKDEAEEMLESMDLSLYQE